MKTILLSYLSLFLLLSSCTSTQAVEPTATTAPATNTTVLSETPEPLPSVTATLAPKATPTEEETFAEPTMDNVEIMGNEWLERWAANQFPLEGNLEDGPLRYYIKVVSDEIITGKAEIMGPN